MLSALAWISLTTMIDLLIPATLAFLTGFLAWKTAAKTYKFERWLEEPPEAPKPLQEPSKPPEAPSPPRPPKIHLDAVLIAMRDFEGLPGDANYLNNNPLNCKYHQGGYLPIYEPVKISPAGFAIFKDYSTGWLYGRNMVKNKIKNHPDWTLYDLIEDHAPPKDNNPTLQYAQTVAKRVGVDIDYKVKNLV